MDPRSPHSLAAALQSLRTHRVGLAAAPQAPGSRSAPAPFSPSDPHLTPDLASSDCAAALLSLHRARLARTRPLRELSLAGEIDTQARLIRSIQRGLVATGIAWDRLLAESGLPQHLIATARIRSFRRGVLTIQLTSAADRYALNTFLRAGGESRLARLAPVSLHKVKLIP